MQGIGNIVRAVSALFLVLGFACESAVAASSSATVPTIVANGPGSLRALLEGKEYVPKADTGRYTASPSGGVTITDTAKGTLPSGKAVDFAVKRQIGANAARAAMKAVAKNILPGVALAVDLWDALKDQGIEPAPTGGAQKDPGQAKQSQGGLMVDFRTGQPMAPGAIAAREAAQKLASCNVSGVNSNGDPYVFACTVEYSTAECSNGRCQWSVGGGQFYQGNRTGSWGASDDRAEIQAEVCPSANGLPVHGSICPSNDRVPATAQDVDEAVDRVPAVRLPTIVRDMDAARHPGVVTEPGPAAIQGPASVPDGVETTTKPDGSTVRREREWSFRYPGDGTIEYEPRLTETGPGGETTTTEGETPQQDQRTDCDKYPESIGCSEYGQPADGAQVPRTARTVAIDPVSLPAAGCPGDVSFQAFGREYTFAMAPVCVPVVDYVKPLMLVAGAVAAAFIFVGGLKV